MTMLHEPMSKEKIVESLAPASSVSRCGKMAEMAMSTHNLARAGVQAFIPVKKKQPKLGIIVAEVVDAELLDPFGTSEPAVDAGRTNELCSSPRAHPQLMAKHNTLKNAERQQLFSKTVNVPLKGGDTSVTPGKYKQSAPWEDMDSHERHLYMFLPPSDDEADGDKAKNDIGTSSFKTVSRDKYKPPNFFTPEVGHYRPRYTIIEKRGQACRLKGKDAPRKKRPATAPAATKRTTIRDSDGRTITLSKDNSKTGEVSLRPQSAATGGRVTPRVINTPGQNPRGTSSFLSKVKNRPGLPKVNENMYWPYNESILSTIPRSGKGAFIDFDQQLNREQSLVGTRGHKPEYDGPDIVYNTDCLKPKVPGYVDMSNKKDTGRLLETQVQYAADHMDYTSNVPQQHVQTINLGKTAGRSEAPILGHRATNTSELPEETPNDSLTHRRQPVVPSFDKQVNGNSFFITAGDLDYEVNYSLVHKKIPAASMQHGDGHQTNFKEALTRECNYNPNYEAIYGKVHGKHHFVTAPTTPPRRGRSSSPSQQPSNDVSDNEREDTKLKQNTASKPPLSGNTDTDITKPRIKGNPMMKLHISREARNAAFKRRTNSPDAFYDYNLDRILPKTTPGASLDFTKTVSRAKPPTTRHIGKING